jgi:site-specific DNA recombinase
MNLENSGENSDAVETAISKNDSSESQNSAMVVQVRKAKKNKRGHRVRKEYDVQVIPATKGVTPVGEEAPAKRVAAYCRVSTDQEAQSSSYELQVKHYTEYIGAHENWVLAGIYADEGITGTQLKHREQFLKMIEDCEAGKIDMIITKSISRFARNTVDCLTIIRKLKALKEPVEIYFEKERLYSLDEKTDMVLSLMASIAQEESRSISANIRWAIKNRMKNGTQKIPTSGLLGYDTDEDGNMVIVAQEAEVVRTIYKSFVQGVHPSLIAIRLNALELKTVYGNDWSGNSVRNILRNEKYCGDVLMQKTITVDYLSHISKPNEGEAEQYYIADHHDAIVSRELWDKAQELLEKQSWQKWKRREQQRLMPVRTGLLTGFVSISRDWKTVSITRLLTASNKVIERGTETDTTSNQLEDNYAVGTAGENNESEDVHMSEIAILEGFEVVELEQSKGDSVLTLTSTNLKFNKATAVELGFPAYVRMLVNAATRQVEIQPCTEKSKNAVKFSREKTKQTYAVVVKIPALLTTVRKLTEVDEDAGSLSFRGTLYPNEKVIIYDLSKGEPVKTRGRRKRDEMKEEQAITAEEE